MIRSRKLEIRSVSMMSVEKKPARISWSALALIFSLSALNLLLIKQNFSLRRQLSSAGRIDASANSLKPGEVTTTPIAGTDLKGRPYQMKYGTDNRRHLLLFFSPSCPYCIQQAPLWANV